MWILKEMVVCQPGDKYRISCILGLDWRESINTNLQLRTFMDIAYYLMSRDIFRDGSC